MAQGFTLPCRKAPLRSQGPRERGLIITIDGPAGAGKSTVARALAQRLNYLYVDTGAMYRAVAHAVLERGISPEDAEAVAGLLPQLQLHLEPSEKGSKIFVNGRDVTEAIRHPQVTAAASQVAAIAAVRERLVKEQRDLAADGGVILEGRDTGSEVVPDADCKIFLTASVAERARRRWLELRRQGFNVELDEVAADIEARDRSDSTRALSPLTLPVGAAVIDSTGQDLDTVIDRILTVCNVGMGR